MPFSDAYANEILNYTLAKTKALTAPSYVYIGLSTNDPEADGGTFNELPIGTAGYSRVMIVRRDDTISPDYIGSASGRAIDNSKQFNWAKATANWERVKGFGLFSSSSGGSPFFYGKLDLTEQQLSEGGLLVPEGAVALFEPDGFGFNFATVDLDA